MASIRYAVHPKQVTSVLVAIFLSACAVYEPPAIQSSQGPAKATQSVSLTAPDDAQTGRVAFHGALSDAFIARGVTVADGAPAIAEFSISTSPADVALLASEAGKTEDPPRPIADPRKRQWTDGCKAVRVRATLALFDRESGNLTKNSTAHATICGDDEPPYQDMATTLIADVLPN